MKIKLIHTLKKIGQKIGAYLHLWSLFIKLALKGAEGSVAASLLLAPFFTHIMKIELAWLNDIVINNYFNWLAQKYAVKKVATISSLDFFSPTFFTQLSTRRRRQPEKSRLQEADVILVPINQHTHWYLLIIQKREDDIFNLITLDGFNNMPFHPALWQKGEELLAFLHPETSHSQRIFTKQSSLIVRQNNLYDCGAVICYYAKEFCEKMQVSQDLKSARNYTLFREEITQAVASHSKEVFFNFGRPLVPEKHEEASVPPLLHTIKNYIGF